jgi:hypothetical protein
MIAINFQTTHTDNASIVSSPLDTPSAQTHELLHQALVDAFCLLEHFDTDSDQGSVLSKPVVLMWLLERQSPALMDALRTESLIDKFQQTLDRLSRLRTAIMDKEEEDSYDPFPIYGIILRPGVASMLELLDTEPEFCRDSGYLPLVEAARAAQQASRDFVPFCASCHNTPLHAIAAGISECRHDTDVSRPLQTLPYFRSDGTPLAAALMRVEDLLATMDDGRYDYFWFDVYTQKLGEWVEEDLPELAGQLATEADASAFFKQSLDYVREMQSVERHWNRLGERLRSILTGPLCTPLQAREVIPRFLEAGVEPHMDDEAYDAAHVERLWLMMLTRKDALICDERAVAFACTESSDLVDSIRKNPQNYNTAYLVDATALPEQLASLAGERQCLALTVPEQRRELIEQLSAQYPVNRFGVEGINGVGATHHLAVNDSFWCHYDDLWSYLFAFRERIPVLYIFENTCLLVTYRFQHFIDLRELSDMTRHTMTWHSADSETDDGRLPSYICRLADGTTIRPKAIDQIADVRKRRASRRLCEAYEREWRPKHTDSSN